MLRAHPRTGVTARADAEFNEAVSQVVKRHQLTSVELMQILAARMQSLLKYMLRHERHPDDPDKGGDEE